MSTQPPYVINEARDDRVRKPVVILRLGTYTAPFRWAGVGERRYISTRRPTATLSLIGVQYMCTTDSTGANGRSSKKEGRLAAARAMYRNYPIDYDVSSPNGRHPLGRATFFP